MSIVMTIRFTTEIMFFKITFYKWTLIAMNSIIFLNPVIITAAEAIHAAPKIHFMCLIPPYPSTVGSKNAHKHHGECVYFIPNITATAVEIQATAFAKSID